MSIVPAHEFPQRCSLQVQAWVSSEADCLAALAGASSNLHDFIVTGLGVTTTSDLHWSGTLGKMLNRVNDLPINSDIHSIPVDASAPLITLSDDVVQDLGGDQKYGYRMVMAIRSGDLPQDLAAMKTGTLSHSRWLTTSNAFMRLYVSNHGLTDPAVLKTLKLITAFIVGMKAVMSFNVTFISTPAGSR